MLNTNVYALKEQKKGFLAQAGEDIGYEKGAKMVKNHFDQNNDEVVSHVIGREILEAILSQPGAVGVTILSGLNEHQQPTPVLVGVNAQGDYILGVTTVGANGQMKKQKGIVAAGVISPGSGVQTNDGCGWY